MDRDKNIANVGIASANRYPIRFVLFETFCDFYKFVHKCAENKIQVIGIEKWLDEHNSDIFPTYSTLSRRINEYIDKANGQDAVITPFSELARFYCNEEFNSLVKTIRLKEANYKSQKKHMRIYIPLIGMQNKLDAFKEDNAIHVWEYVAPVAEKQYRLILCKCFNFNNILEKDQYSLCQSLKDWVALWKQGSKVNSNIICSSKTLFNISGNARPDNAFDYTICHNAFELLRDGLKIIPQSIQLIPAELPYWENLASEIKDIQSFSLDSFILNRFNVLRLKEAEFMQFWFKSNAAFSRWLLKIYYLTNFCEDKYLCRALTQCETTHTSELFEKLALLIFDDEYDNIKVEERRVLLSTGMEYGAKISEQAETNLKGKLIKIAESPEFGYLEALKYVTTLTETEKQLLVIWLGEEKISRDSIKSLLPDLYAYTAPIPRDMFAGAAWLEEYFNEYRFSKIANSLSSELSALIHSHNGSTASFETWKNEFKTVKTILSHRSDVEVYYWIDGLGIDWLPFINQVIEEHQGDGVFLNEVCIGTAQLPTTTSVNKAILESLPHARLKKIGDLDEFAHSHKQYPDYLCDELKLVRQAIEHALSLYNGKKIAFVSDHGISYMAQHGKAFKLASAIGEHSGRCATWKQPRIPQDKKYIITDDEKMICSLSHNSLTDKTPYGIGAHGGATPEELLVPIFIVSGQKNKSNYTAVLLQHSVTINTPIVRYKIKGTISNTLDVPVVEYNGNTYPLHNVGKNVFESEKLNLVQSSNKVTIVIGDFSQTDTISVETGVYEEDIFGDF